MDETYLLHQTPRDLAIDLIQKIDLVEGDVVLDAFKGEGAFFDSFPEFVNKQWCEKTQGRDYKDFSGMADWIITNPPYRIEEGDNRINALWLLLDYFSLRVRKGIAFLINDKCLSTLTPKRLSILAERGFALTNITVCSVKKWRGRYYFIVFKKEPVRAFDFLLKNY
jgi:hypothetical protein